MRSMLKITHLTLVAVVGIAVLSAGCGSSASFQPVGAASPSCGGKATGGDAVAPAAGVVGGTRWLFRCDKPLVAFRPASIKLANLVGNIHGLGTAGLKSTKDAAAVILVEDDPAVQWGTHLHAAEAEIFRTFAGERSLGAWLIMVTDVVVHAAKDPIPPTAYRWSRAEVAAFVACGMPASAGDPCHDTFWQSADQVVLAPAGGQPHGR
jgi:hypothetical protein